uniref:Glycosyltransferase 2-like domain-containing protein n=1 Tax=Chromera velia CCMP2878 TaxID=1169474 RepID=A0A0G4I5P9_9ALVE|eukprot:Cvel_11232.t1-p1 / transcript=Cvel_11232.t1 / gene=Cvel_11232 / organism=Chromera_velia_CCMP2878 / gene_product=Beta-1,4-mannosyltransferase bre-3, putative / transcript_product=Beta-1,4-mannosyltransferase bre-3, putative / location=Cvel_scaffold699:32055-39267(+) / protein_length=625 / sequence_SO=supercontig / SO=protein_coding / is_pseudo=false
MQAGTEKGFSPSSPNVKRRLAPYYFSSYAYWVGFLGFLLLGWHHFYSGGGEECLKHGCDLFVDLPSSLWVGYSEGTRKALSGMVIVYAFLVTAPVNMCALLVFVGLSNPMGVMKFSSFNWPRMLRVFDLNRQREEEKKQKNDNSSRSTEAQGDEEAPLFLSLSPSDHPNKTHRHIFFRVVTRGTNPDLTAHSTSHNLKILKSFTEDKLLFEPRIEIVTDECLSFVNEMQPEAEAAGAVLSQLVVRPDYQSCCRSKFKARALQYAIEYTTGKLDESPPVEDQIDDRDVIVHLDEETKLTEEVVQGILEFFTEGGQTGGGKGFDRIGQGIIVYGHDDPLINIWTTMADCVRVLDDYARFRFFLSLGYPLQGMKGSFICMSAHVEREVSFDVGPQGSTTEDACVALMAVEKGFKSGFIRGVMMERSPFSWDDWLKQRRRTSSSSSLLEAAGKGIWKILVVSAAAWLHVWLMTMEQGALLYTFFTWHSSSGQFHLIKKEFEGISGNAQKAGRMRAGGDDDEQSEGSCSNDPKTKEDPQSPLPSDIEDKSSTSKHERTPLKFSPHDNSNGSPLNVSISTYGSTSMTAADECLKTSGEREGSELNVSEGSPTKSKSDESLSVCEASLATAQ